MNACHFCNTTVLTVVMSANAASQRYFLYVTICDSQRLAGKIFFMLVCQMLCVSCFTKTDNCPRSDSLKFEHISYSDEILSSVSMLG